MGEISARPKAMDTLQIADEIKEILRLSIIASSYCGGKPDGSDWLEGGERINNIKTVNSLRELKQVTKKLSGLGKDVFDQIQSLFKSN